MTNNSNTNPHQVNLGKYFIDWDAAIDPAKAMIQEMALTVMVVTMITLNEREEKRFSGTDARSGSRPTPLSEFLLKGIPGVGICGMAMACCVIVRSVWEQQVCTGRQTAAVAAQEGDASEFRRGRARDRAQMRRASTYREQWIPPHAHLRLNTRTLLLHLQVHQHAAEVNNTSAALWPRPSVRHACGRQACEGSRDRGVEGSIGPVSGGASMAVKGLFPHRKTSL